MRRITLSVSVVVVLLLGLFVTMGINTRAQETTPETTATMVMATHPVVGLWQTVVSNEGMEPFTSLSTFHADGAYTEVLPFGAVVSGVWRPTGERTAVLTAYLNYFNEDRLVNAEVRLTVEVDETGNALTEEGTVVERYEDGSILNAGGSPATGTRLEVLPVIPLSELAPEGTPVTAAEQTDEATPAP
jgi:hypothetical protein